MTGNFLRAGVLVPAYIRNLIRCIDADRTVTAIVLRRVIQLEVITMKKLILDFIREEEGLTTVEYAIAGGLVGAAVIVAFTDLGTAVGNVVVGITTELNGAAGP